MGMSVAEIKALMNTAGKPTEGIPNHEKKWPNICSIKAASHVFSEFAEAHFQLAKLDPLFISRGYCPLLFAIFTDFQILLKLLSNSPNKPKID
jgi:hypothetical protein